jgi:hypothetical protein
MVSTFAIVIVLIMSVTILAISTRVILSLNRGIDSYSERQAYWNAHSAVSVWESDLQFEATTTYNSVNGWDTGEIIIDSTGMKGIGKTGSDSNIVWIVELDEREEQGGRGADPNTVFTFTNCGKEGRSGPSQEQCDIEYEEGVVTVTVDNGIQEWTVPETGAYTIEAWGAAGGGNHGGKGVKISADFVLIENDVILILVGQQGITSSPMSSGGGGTFVVKQSGNEFELTTKSVFVEPLIIAGGGGGSSNSPITTQNGTTLTSGQTGYGGWQVLNLVELMEVEEAELVALAAAAVAAVLRKMGLVVHSDGKSFLNGGTGGVRTLGSEIILMGVLVVEVVQGITIMVVISAGGAGGGYSGGGGACKGNTQPRFERGGGGGSYCGDQSDGECDVDENATGEGNEWELNEGHGKVIITVME